MLAAGCSPAVSPPPNILLITLDTTRADHVGAYGDTRARTPTLDRLAAGGVLFERAVATAPLTLPAHVSLFTGRYPFAHGVRNNGNFMLEANASTLATALHDRGYRSAAFVSAFVLDRRFGLARGFDTYDDAVEQAATRGGEVERRGDRTATAAIQWMSAHADGHVPIFVWLHLYDPHDPYDPPLPFREQFADRPYDGEIAFDDEVVGRVLQQLDALHLRDSTIVAVVGDHGESLGEHEETTHALFVYQAALHVPLILSWPGHLSPGRRVAPIVSAIDLAPTLLDLAGQPPLAGATGLSLAGLMSGRDKGLESAYSETYFPYFYMGWAPLMAIQDRRWKFIEAPSPELYDLVNDPGELTNLAAREPSRVAAFRNGLRALTGGGAGAMAARRVDRETAEKLASLGYIGVGDGQAPVASRRDPKAMIGVFNQIRAANAAVQDRRPADGERLAREALASDPDNAFAILVLAQAEMDQVKYRPAVSDFRRYAQLVPSSADAHHRIAICLSRLADANGALAEETAALAIDPRDAEAHELRGGLLAGTGRLGEAIRELQTAVDIEPAAALFRVGLARAMIQAGQFEKAAGEVDRALAIAPNLADAHAAHGGLLAARGDHPAAAAAYARALQLRPEYDDVRLDYADELDRAGRHAEAQTEYRRLAGSSDTPTPLRRAARERVR